MFNEEQLEDATLSILENLGYERLNGYNIDRDYHSVFMDDCLFDDLCKINKDFNDSQIQEAIKTIKTLSHGNPIEDNKIFTRYLLEGVPVQIKTSSGYQYKNVKLIDFENINNNHFQAINQFSIIEFDTKRPDIIVFINGIPLIVIELKTATNEDVKLEDAYTQLTGYRNVYILSLFKYNQFLVISDGVTAKAGTITSPYSRFSDWKKVEDTDEVYENMPTHETLFKGLFRKDRLLDIIENFILFSDDKKILSQYHQYFGVKKAIVSTVTKGVKTGKAGIIWHTQGSGKSFSMVFYSGNMIKMLNNPTIVVVTDRNDLDSQLYETFVKCDYYLKQKPQKAESRQSLDEMLKDRLSGGIFFTTLQKFEEETGLFTDRDDILVLVDEAHRSHYGLEATMKIDYETNEAKEKFGTAKYLHNALPNAIYIGFTGTPVETKDKSTSSIFVDVIDTYDMTQAILDGSTVPIMYESRMARVGLNQKILDQIDDYYKQIEESGEADDYAINKSKQMMAKISQVIEDPDRLELIVKDIINHFEERKDMVADHAMVVAYSRKAAYTMYQKFLELRPDYKDVVNMIITPSNKDSEEMQKAIGTKNDKKELEIRFKNEADDPNEKFKIAIVVDNNELVNALKDKVEIIDGILNRFDYSNFNDLDNTGKYNLIKDGANLVLSSEDKKKRFMKHSLDAKNLYTLCNGILEQYYKDKVLFIISVRSFISKITNENKLDVSEINRNVGVMLEQSIREDELINLGELSRGNSLELLSNTMLSKLKSLKDKNVAAEILSRAIKSTISEIGKINLTLQVKFSTKFNKIVDAYNERTDLADIEKIIEEMINLKKEIEEELEKGNEYDLSSEEKAFFDALGADSEIKELMKDDFNTFDFISDYSTKFNIDANIVSNKVTKLRAIKNVSIGRIELGSVLDIDTVTEIFVRINSAGVVLSQADFAMSKISVNEKYHGNDIRKTIDYFCHFAKTPIDYENIKKNDEEFSSKEIFSKIAWIKDKNEDLYLPSYVDVLRVAFTYKFRRGKLQDLVSLLSGHDFETRDYKEEVVAESYSKLYEGVRQFVNQYNFEKYVMILKSAGIIDGDLVRSQNVLNFGYILYLLLREKQVAPDKIETLVRRWVIMSIVTQRYTSSPESQFDLDIRKLNDNDNVEQYIEEELSREMSGNFFDNILPERFNTPVASSPFWKTFLIAQIKLNNRAFLSKDIDVRTLIEGRGDVHHIFPKDYLQKNGKDNRSIYNQIANFAMLQTEVNIQIGKKAPNEYMKSIIEQCNGKDNKYGAINTIDDLYKNMEENCIPISFIDMTIENYDAFLKERRKLMAQKLKEYYKNL